MSALCIYIYWIRISKTKDTTPYIRNIIKGYYTYIGKKSNMMIRSIIFFLVTMSSLFSSAQPFIPARLANQGKKYTLNDRIPNNDPSTDKICSKCKNFNAYDKTCKLFYGLNLVDGREYDRAIDARRNENKCGVKGEYYIKDIFFPIKKLGGVLVDWYIIIVTGGYVFLYIYFMSYKDK